MKAYLLVCALLNSGALYAIDYSDREPLVSPAKSEKKRSESAGSFAAIQQQIEHMREEYESRLKDLERRLAVAEKQAVQTETLQLELEEAVDELALAPLGNQPVSRASDFNPGIGVIMVGGVQRFSSSIDGFEVPGFQLGEETGLGEEGFSIGESDFTLSGNIDDQFFGSMTLAVTKEEGVILEEAYLETTGLGAGLQLKGGKFFSDIGYLNSKHLHADDFVGRPLPYRAMLGNQYGDDGLQLSWLAPTEWYWKLGLELFRGEGFPSGGSAHKGMGTWAITSHWGGDIGLAHSWRAGLSILTSDIDGRETEDAEQFSGESELTIADFIYKWAPAGNAHQRSLKLQGEYFSRSEQGIYSSLSADSLDYRGDQSGWYLEGVYQFLPSWRIGIRHSQVSADTLDTVFADSSLDSRGHSPKDNSVMLDWTHSEFSRIRLQYRRDESMPDGLNIWSLQYIMSLGAHAAHSF